MMFTGMIDKKGEKKVKEMGGELVDSVFHCTHLVTDKVSHQQHVACHDMHMLHPLTCHNEYMLHT